MGQALVAREREETEECKQRGRGRKAGNSKVGRERRRQVVEVEGRVIRGKRRQGQEYEREAWVDCLVGLLVGRYVHGGRVEVEGRGVGAG